MDKYGFRAKALLSLLVTWAVVVTAHVFYYTVYARDSYLAEGDKLAMRKGIIPSIRGKILDKNGLELAWTEKYFDLYLNNEPEIYLRKTSLLAALEKILGNPVNLAKDAERLLVKKNLDPETLLKLEPLLSEYPEIKIIQRFERRCVDYPDVKALIGKVELKDARLHGYSGLEMAYDEALYGRDGSYTVMIDRNGNWMKGSWKLEAEPNSYDIRLEKSLEELRGSQDGKHD